MSSRRSFLTGPNFLVLEWPHRFRDVFPLSPELRKNLEEEKKDKP
jgi:hypothetical protein